MFPYVALTKDKQWQAGPYPGVELMPLHRNEKTGGVTILRKFHAGMTIPAHIHPDANEFVYVLSGEWEESGVIYASGAFFFAPRGVAHGPHIARTDVVNWPRWPSVSAANSAPELSISASPTLPIMFFLLIFITSSFLFFGRGPMTLSPPISATKTSRRRCCVATGQILHRPRFAPN